MDDKPQLGGDKHGAGRAPPEAVSRPGDPVPVQGELPALLLDLADVARLGLVVTDTDGRIVGCTTHFANLLGRPISEIEGRSFLAFTAAEDHESERRAFTAFLSSGRRHSRIVQRYSRPDGAFAWAEVCSTLLYDAAGSPCRLVSLTRDLTESRRLADSLRASELAYLQLFRETTDGLAVFDVVRDPEGRPHDLRCVDLNPAFERMTGRPAQLCIGRLVRDAWPDSSLAWLERVLEALRNDRSTRFEDRLFTRDRWFDVRVFSVSHDRCAMFVTDITQRAEEERQRREMLDRAQQLQKLESLGRLAGGIAHDFNNLLMAMLGGADLARAELPAHHPACEHLDRIIQAARRGSELCRQLLDYAGRGRLTVSEFSLNDLIEDMAHLIAISLPRNVHLDCKLASSLPPIRGDPSRIMQAILNLVTNAAEALDDSPGIIQIVTATERFDQPADAGPGSSAPLPPGLYVRFDVSDTGPGMSPDTMERIFDPFFSTRMEGRGLGLPAVLGIVRSHGGGIRVNSRPGHGSTFQLLFPAASPPSPHPATPPPTRHLWVIERDDRLRESITRMLQATHYSILSFANMEDAFAAVRSPECRVDGIVLGGELVASSDELRAIRRIAPVVLVGEPYGSIPTDIEVIRLARPFARADLIHAVRTACPPGEAGPSSPDGQPES